MGLLTGTLFVAMSLTPSLIPRPWLYQGIISGISMICGYGMGISLRFVWKYLELPLVPQKYQKPLTVVPLVVSVVILIFFLYKTTLWQNNILTLLGLPQNDSAFPLFVILLALPIGYVLLVLFRALLLLGQTVFRAIAKRIPHRYGRVISIIAVVALFGVLLNGILINGAVAIANSIYALTDTKTAAGVIQPQSALRSGGPGSLVAWDTLGNEGRTFIGLGPSRADISRIWSNGEVRDPIRIYVGLASATTTHARSELALQELIRTKAFDRTVLVVMTSTGMGSIDPNAADTLEYMYAGNTAVIASQYSFLPSALSLLLEKEAARESSIDMFETVHRYWQNLDPATRPRLYLYGLSLGAYGSEAAISRFDLLNDPMNGALWVGPPFVSEYWKQITDSRDQGSSYWLPTYDRGSTVRFTNNGENLNQSSTTWQRNRFIYLQHGDDPIVFFSYDLLYRKPEWLQGVRSPEVTADMQWFPIVTFWQTGVDMLLSNSLSTGYGHNYSAASYIDSWVALTQPEKWDSEKTAKLKALTCEPVQCRMNL